MKNFKKGFTLAEVLITLAIIGVVAAIVMPSVIMSYQYKAVGTKLAKFAALTENAARAFVASNGMFDTENNTAEVLNFANDTYIFKEVYEGTDVSDNIDRTKPLSLEKDLTKVIMGDGSQPCEDGWTLKDNKCTKEGQDPTNPKDTYNAEIGLLKDGTALIVIPAGKGNTGALQYKDTDHTNAVDPYKLGEAAFSIVFDPKVSGVPTVVQNLYSFTVTENGYVVPSADDACLWKIYDNDFAVYSADYSETGICNGNGGKTGTESGQKQD